MSGVTGDWDLRAATMVDLAALSRLELVVFGSDAWSSRSLADELAPHDAVAASSRGGLVASDGEGIVGYAFLRWTDDVGEIFRVAVVPAYRRQGVGTALVEALLQTARRQQCTSVLLEVGADNAAALRCYAQLGFTELDRRRGYYAGGVDALVLRATI